MRSITFNPEDYFYLLRKVTYTLRTRTKTGIEVDVIMEGVKTSTISYWASWRNFKKWVKYIK